MVHGGRRRGALGHHARKLLWDALALAHRLTLDLDGIGVVDDPVTDGVGQGGVVQVLVPLAGVILGTEDGGGHLVPGFYQFQHIPGLCLFEGGEQPLVQNKQLLFPEPFHVIPVGSVGPSHRDFRQQIRQADIPNGIKTAAGGHAKGAGQVGHSGTGSAQDDHISCLLNVRTGCQAEDLLPVQMPFGNILDILHAGLCIVSVRQENHWGVFQPDANIPAEQCSRHQPGKQFLWHPR